MTVKYTPNQGDLIWLDFNPSRGHEIVKRRPAIVISKTPFNRLTQFAVVCPITSTITDFPTNFSLIGYQTTGQIMTSQIASYDLSQLANRQPEFIEKLRPADLEIVLQMVEQIFE